MYSITVSRKRSLTLPRAFNKLLSNGNRFMAFESDDAIMLKQIKEPIWHIAERTPDPKKPTTDEINEMVSKARRETAKKK
jgi:hypothetical protein